MKEKTLQYK